jgi:streptogramin lyase
MTTYRKGSAPVLLGALLFAAFLGLVATASADLPAQETLLNPEGRAYEVNAGTDGTLWVSDSGAEEIRALDPASGLYTVYRGAGGVSDARQAPDGSVWWIDQIEDRLGRLEPGSGEATVWEIPGATTLLGTALDGDGGVWLSQYFDPQVYRFTVASGQLCTYTLGSIGGSDYVLADGAAIWLGDWINDRVHRLEPDSGLLTSWTLPGNARPEGLAMDWEGHLWWADPDRRYLARLEPERDRLLTYALPPGSVPGMVAASGQRLWYTEYQQGSVGRLDPFLASATSHTLPTDTVTLSPSCSTISPHWTGTLSKSSGTIAWASAAYTNTIDSDGWWIHELPRDAFLWGIAARGGRVWVVDNGRQVLARMEDSLSLVACTQADGDGDLNTTGDRTPLEGWTIQLIADGQPVEPGQLTAPNGCTVWGDLEPGVSYGVAEEAAPGWVALADTSHAFGVLVPGQVNIHTFVNAQSVEVSACKLLDADGDLDTRGDQEPLEDWTVYLVADGQRQGSGQTTGTDGCHVWSDLTPAHRYGVEEEVESGWKALTATNHDFGLALPGESYRTTFINSPGAELIFLPLVLRP